MTKDDVRHTQVATGQTVVATRGPVDVDATRRAQVAAATAIHDEDERVTLADLLEEQRRLELKFGVDFAVMTIDERVQFIKDMTLALENELHEALNETAWKPWQRGPRYVNYGAYAGEVVDAFHLILCLMLAGNMSADDLVRGYRAKRELNAKRQIEGYTGQNKCPVCARALDDEATECVVEDVAGSSRRRVYCVEL